jgi:hypothetical protein
VSWGEGGPTTGGGMMVRLDGGGAAGGWRAVGGAGGAEARSWRRKTAGGVMRRTKTADGAHTWRKMTGALV